MPEAGSDESIPPSEVLERFDRDESDDNDTSKDSEKLKVVETDSATTKDERSSMSGHNTGDNGEEDEEEEEEEDTEPPMLKYTRITKLPKNFFQRDSISACLFHDKLFAFATHSGIIHLTEPDLTTIRTFKCHRSSIMAIHTDGEYFATASIDGTVVVGSIENASDIMAFDFKRPVHSVVLDQNYRTSKVFISGGMAGEVIVSQRNWIGTRVDTKVDRDHGPIVGIYTVDDIVFWMNDSGITFYSISSKSKLLCVPFPTDDSIRPDLYRPRVHFPEVNTIIVCWGVSVWTFKVSLANQIDRQKKLGSILTTAASSLRALPDKKVELETYFKMDCLIAGVASFKDDQLLVLGINAFNSKSGPPELKVVDMLTGEEIHNDEIISKNFQNLSLNDYHLGKYIGANTPEYYLISANDAILVKELTLEDRYTWYMENRFYFKAWEVGRFVMNDVDRLKTGLAYINQILEEKKWDEAAKMTNTIFGAFPWKSAEDAAARPFARNSWQDIIRRFFDADKVNLIAPHIPTEPQLDTAIYETVLFFYIDENSSSQLSEYSKKWPFGYYSPDILEDKLEDKLRDVEGELRREFCQALCHLYLVHKKYLPAVGHLIDMKDPEALDLLIKEDMLVTFLDRLVEIILLPYAGPVEEINNLSLGVAQTTFSKPVELLVQNRNSIPMSQIIDTFSQELQIILFLYFKGLSAVEPLMAVPYETQLVELYARFKQSELLSFLKKHSNYDIDRAIKICSQKDGYHQELIYLWGKIGETRKALSLIIDKLNDPALAISFVIDSNDSDLWHFLVSYSLDKPNFIKSLLEHRDEYGEKTLEVMKKIPPDTELDDDLRLILGNITRDNWLSLSVNKGVFKIIDDETKEVALEFLETRSRGKLFDGTII
ncbi:AGR149Wp [Eremothecium gossypii ATCC 10895]|uniref:Vacuolar protein sorting-associated protein 41 n=1 Tax=Eremothecium gossypii (strain ATCC 10895 / CBS 109.51 / FGSC 9923 / NRRL Y-1056) TaxID=284811 RepID=Q74ZP9_EREGS|nr:AGR149Wp [Eremothecium gossypii ATCC 10895]AAS54639.1 AGR149Wp [Eremothecium gossypii ATCC 10895]